MVFEPDDADFDIDDDSPPVYASQRRRAVRWTALVVVLSFVLAFSSSVSPWW